MDRAEKSELVATLNQVFKDTGTVVVAHYAGLSVADMTAFRGKMRDAGAGVKVAKNRLAKLALKGTDVETIADLLKGPTVVAYSRDPVAAAKVAIDFAKTNEKLVVKAGAHAGKALDAKGVKALAAIPSREVLIAQIAGMLRSPIQRLAGVLAALAEKKGAAA